ncbi:CWC16 protein [Chaetomium tenue]|uniref:CWC16 protein n=1 Tax=Chaetomium tenue TaxID=1854479 RepID=A0ACB7PHT7_9PEZI|nr:CWC16 protein [Chaetomium globosum]
MQGFNMGRYTAPDDGSSGDNNTHHNKKHPLGARASKLASHGILVVRFEMPFAIWCAHCPEPCLIGQGVRFNAEKRRVGNYHSTPVWAFDLKHAACGGLIEMRTDPRQGDYVIVSGARRRNYGDREKDVAAAADAAAAASGGGAGGGGGSLVVSEFEITTERERAEKREAAFWRLEKTIAHRVQTEEGEKRIEELQGVAARWEDPYSTNQKLRKTFRAGRHMRERDTAKAEDLKERMGLGIELLPEREEDGRQAKLIRFGAPDPDWDGEVRKALRKPLFETSLSQKKDNEGASTGGRKKLKSEIAAARARENLASEVIRNTKAAKDPFLNFDHKKHTPKQPARIPGLKRKSPVEDATTKQDTPKEVAGTTALVDYDSDSD